MSKSNQGNLRFWYVMVCIALFASTLQPLASVQAEGVPPTRLFLPLMNSVAIAPSEDFLIQRVEVTQGIQDAQNGVPLVAGRPTMLRIYAVNQCLSNCANRTPPEVSIAIQADALTTQAEAAPPYFYKVTLGEVSLPEIVTSSVNIALPAAWTSGSYNLQITVDADHRIEEADETNNVLVQPLRFVNVPALPLVIVPVEYTSSETGAVYPAPTEDTISAFIKKLYPVAEVQVQWHAPYQFKGNMKDVRSFSDLLGEIATLRDNENAPAAAFYYALVPVRNASGSWFSSGVVGIGYIGARAAVGLDFSGAGATAAHEIGHNLGRYHSPCGNPSGIDPNYPYRDGSIGQFGFDPLTGTLYSPDTARDIMSYCSPKWISDYTYRALFTRLSAQADVAASGVPQPAQTILQVRAQVTESGAAFLPAYALTGSPTPAAVSEYQLQWLNVAGAVMGSVPVPVYDIDADEAGLLHEMRAAVVVPPSAVRMRLLKGDAVLAERALPGVQVQSVEAVQVSRDADGLHLRWGNPQTPVMLRYSADQGNTWTVLAVDHTGGQYRIDPAAFPAADGIFQVLMAQ